MSKPKPINVRPIKKDSIDGRAVYKVLQLARKDHPDLKQGRIVLAFNDNMKPDVDGNVTLCKRKVIGELERQIVDGDLLIIFNKKVYDQFQPEQRAALMDHALCGFDVQRDKDANTAQDADDRHLYRKRKPDFVGYEATVRRHGLWMRDLQSIADLTRDLEANPLFAAQIEEEAAAEDPPSAATG